MSRANSPSSASIRSTTSGGEFSRMASPRQQRTSPCQPCHVSARSRRRAPRRRQTPRGRQHSRRRAEQAGHANPASDGATSRSPTMRKASPRRTCENPRYTAGQARRAITGRRRAISPTAVSRLAGPGAFGQSRYGSLSRCHVTAEPRQRPHRDRPGGGVFHADRSRTAARPGGDDAPRRRLRQWRRHRPAVRHR